MQEISFGKLLWVSGGYAPIFTKLQVGDLTIYYNIKKKGDPFVLRNIWTAPYINANRCTCSQSFANCHMKLLCLFTTLYVQIVMFDNTVPHNLRSFLAANSTQNYFLIDYFFCDNCNKSAIFNILRKNETIFGIENG